MNYEWNVNLVNGSLCVLNKNSGDKYEINLDSEEIVRGEFPKQFTTQELEKIYYLNKKVSFIDAVNCIAVWKYTEIDKWLYKDSFHPYLRIIETKSNHYPYLGKIITQVKPVRCVVMEENRGELICINLENYKYQQKEFETVEQEVSIFTKMQIPKNKVAKL